MQTLHSPTNSSRKEIPNFKKINHRDSRHAFTNWYAGQQSWDQLNSTDQSEILSTFRDPDNFDVMAAVY